jgi:hypothetical protein
MAAAAAVDPAAAATSRFEKFLQVSVAEASDIHQKATQAGRVKEDAKMMTQRMKGQRVFNSTQREKRREDAILTLEADITKAEARCKLAFIRAVKQVRRHHVPCLACCRSMFHVPGTFPGRPHRPHTHQVGMMKGALEIKKKWVSADKQAEELEFTDVAAFAKQIVEREEVRHACVCGACVRA